MTQDNTEGNAVAERIRAADISVNNSSSIDAMLANALKEKKPIADDGKLHDTIQEAENAASSFIFVPPGTFYENVTIKTSGLTLIGSGRSTLINGKTSGHAIEITASETSVESVSLMTEPGAGNNYHGLLMNTGATGNNVDSVIIRDSDGDGIASNGEPNRFIRNCIVESADDIGIALRDQPIMSATGCLVQNTGSAGILTGSGGSDHIIANCIIKGAGGKGIYMDTSDSIIGGNRIQNSGSDGIGTDFNPADSIIFNNRISGSGSGTAINVSSSTNTIEGNLTGAAN